MSDNGCEAVRYVQEERALRDWYERQYGVK